VPSSKRDEPPRRVEILRRTSLARREFPASDGREDTGKEFLSRSIDADAFAPSRRGAATLSAQLHLPTLIASRYDPSGDSSRPRRRRGTGSRRARSRDSGAPARAIAFFVSVAKMMMMRVSTRHRVARRLTRAARSTPPTPPQMASKDGSTFFFTSESVNEGHPDKLADQVRDRDLSIRALSFNADRRFFARRDREKRAAATPKCRVPREPRDASRTLR
jgi:hypothetical protein